MGNYMIINVYVLVYFLGECTSPFSQFIYCVCDVKDYLCLKLIAKEVYCNSKKIEQCIRFPSLVKNVYILGCHLFIFYKWRRLI